MSLAKLQSSPRTTLSFQCSEIRSGADKTCVVFLKHTPDHPYRLHSSLCQHCHGRCVRHVDEKSFNAVKVGDSTPMCSSFFLVRNLMKTSNNKPNSLKS